MDTVIDLNGTWDNGGVPGPIIAVNGDSISVDMSAYNRPVATGTILNNNSIKVTFPDEANAVYTGDLELPGIIVWSNGSTWTKDATAITTLFDLNGIWESGNVPGPFIKMSGNAISVDMSVYNRPNAAGTVLAADQISVNFPDDKMYTGQLQSPGAIVWNNNAFWTKAPASLTTVINLAGRWASGDVQGPIIDVNGKSIAVDMAAYSRPNATGTILAFDKISVNFPDDGVYMATLRPSPDRIIWANNSEWTRTPLPKAPSGLRASLSADGSANSIINVSWQDNSDNEDGFYVQMSNSVHFGQDATVGANTTQTFFTVANDGTTYSISVRAFNNVSGNSAFAGPVEVTVPTTTVKTPQITANVQTTPQDPDVWVVHITGGTFAKSEEVSLKITWAQVGGSTNNFNETTKADPTFGTITYDFFGNDSSGICSGSGSGVKNNFTVQATGLTSHLVSNLAPASRQC